MLRPFYLLAFKIFGWKTSGQFPTTIKQFVIAVAPHTSNWDFLVGLAGRSILRVSNAKFIGKSSLFNPPFGWVFRWLGGYPVDRSKSHNMVEQVTQIFKEHDKFILALAPEGTRKKVDKLKTGFYYIAKAANVPIVPVGFDYKRKLIIVGNPFYTTSDFEADMKELLDFYRSISGKNPALGIS